MKSIIPEGLELRDFQCLGVEFALRSKNTILADDMGLGKTIEAIVVANIIDARNVLIICPATVKYNWVREWRKWSIRPDLKLSISSGDYWGGSDSDVVVINYDILGRHTKELHSRIWDLVIVDESHYIKNHTAQRTKAVLSVRAERKLLLTGTPILNRPIELWTQLLCIGAVKPDSYMKYARRFCNAHQIRVGGKMIWNLNGASNLETLQDNIYKKCILRRTKAEVLKELPPKRRQVIELSGGGGGYRQAHRVRRLVEKELACLPEKYRIDIANLEAQALDFVDMALARHALALEKVPAVVEFLRDALENSDKIVCFAHHREVIRQIADKFPNHCVVLTGGMNAGEKQAAVDSFQTDPEIRLFIGNIQAAGVGITLTAASHVVFAELDWVPGNITQAEDRCHRIGQEDSVLVQHLVLDGSLDATMAQMIVAKQDVIDRAIPPSNKEVN